jgi:two-component system, OmpR family, response regulator
VKLLVLEDDADLRSALRRGFRRAGHVVDDAGTLEDARWLAAESAYDALVLDVMVPDGDGFAFCRELREAGDRTPVLLLTARDAVVDRVRGLDVGADDYLVKPFAFEELLARVRALGRRGPSSRPVRHVLGALEVDQTAHRATVAGRPLELTARQFALLALFAGRTDQVLSRSQIIDQLWDWAFEGDPRIVDVYVNALRRSLGEGPGVPRLETVRGAGYALRPPPTA